MNFTATSTSRVRWRASHTEPIEPRPSRRTRRKRPEMVAPGKILGADSDDGPLAGIRRFPGAAAKSAPLPNSKASLQFLGTVKGCLASQALVRLVLLAGVQQAFTTGAQTRYGNNQTPSCRLL